MLEQIDLYRTASHPCSYLPGRTAATVLIDPKVQLNPSDYGQLLAQGFRRSGDHIYRPWCRGCKRCVSVRVPVSDFTPARRQRRVAKRNAGVALKIVESRYRDEHFGLYRRYLGARHGDGEMADPKPEDFQGFMVADWADTQFIELREGPTLLAVAVTDWQPDSLSAVYTFFDPDLSERSLGVLAVLHQIGLAKALGYRWLYLGYWIDECRKMSYKTEYRPIELLEHGRWQLYAHGQAIG
jgi:arginine-tRNA-protein transferase